MKSFKLREIKDPYSQTPDSTSSPKTSSYTKNSSKSSKVMPNPSSRFYKPKSPQTFIPSKPQSKLKIMIETLKNPQNLTNSLDF